GGQTNFVLLRALFESSLALNFLLQDNKFHEDRGVAYWAGYRIDQLETRLKYDPATAKGIALQALIDADPVLSLATYPRRDLKNEREELERALQSPAYKPSWEKWQEAKKKSRLFSGIPSAQRPKIFVNWPDCSGEKLNTKFSTVIYPESLTLKMCFLVSWTEPLIDPSPYIRSVDQK
ncbi:MAG TPA: hypothetical protein VK901_21795, partial [Nitrospiraceae bacterium]|nr:hypothetical protein [Nitrospiraceae bacterium]